MRLRHERSDLGFRAPPPPGLSRRHRVPVWASGVRSLGKARGAACNGRAGRKTARAEARRRAGSSARQRPSMAGSSGGGSGARWRRMRRATASEAPGRASGPVDRDLADIARTSPNPDHGLARSDLCWRVSNSNGVVGLDRLQAMLGKLSAQIGLASTDLRVPVHMSEAS